MEEKISEVDSLFADKVKKHREQRSLTQADVAAFVGVSRLTLTGIENKHQRATLRQALRLSKLLGIDLMKLPLDGHDE